jgi:hypothetical protein
MTEDAIEAIMRGIRLGLHPDRAAMAAGVKASTMRMHKRANPEFLTAIKEAEAVAERGFLSRIIQHSQRQWTAAAWMLERRFPDRWKRQDGTQEVKLSGTVRNDGPAAPTDAKALSDYAALFAAAAASLRLPEHEDPTADPA